MSSVECLREFVNERLTAAAEEIFRVFKQTVVEYEEEIDRQRRLLDIIWKPEVKLHRIEVPQQHVCKEEEVLTDQLFNQEEPQPPEVKEEQEDLCTSQDGKQLVLEQETDTFMCTSSYKESDPNEDQTLYFKPDKTQCAAEKDSAVNVPVITSVVSVPHVAKSPAQKGDKPSRSTRNAKPKTQHHKSTNHKNNANKSTGSKIQDDKSTDKKPFKCDTCGKVFKLKSQLSSHMRVHTSERPYSCDTCGKTFSDIYCLKTHLTIHTGEKPFLCKTCGKSFRLHYLLSRHLKLHTDERPYSCDTCGKRFCDIYRLKAHLAIHTGEKPYLCKTCGKSFRLPFDLSRHIKVHTGEKPYSCNICGKSFCEKWDVQRHTRIHTEKPYTCKTCEMKFRTARHLTSHMTRAHTLVN